ncbi:transcriptional regulator, partial [Xanthomonas citri pv. citri]|nr:transcriptional regulator [Xanthomonas citri pv. citri]
RAHESLDSVRLSLAPSSSTAPTGADQGLRAALQGLRREIRESWLRSLGALTPAGSALDAGASATAAAVPGQTDPATLSDDDLAAARRDQRLAVALPVVRR